MIDDRSPSPNLNETIPGPQTGIEPTTIWRPVRRFNHWVTKTQMASSCASSTYVLSDIHGMLIMIVDICWSLEISSIIDEHLSSPRLRKTISEPQTGSEHAKVPPISHIHNLYRLNITIINISSTVTAWATHGELAHLVETCISMHKYHTLNLFFQPQFRPRDVWSLNRECYGWIF